MIKVSVKKYKSIDGYIYDTKKQAQNADKAELNYRKEQTCKHEIIEKYETRRHDVGHHDWVNCTYRIHTCKKCKFRDETEL